jgi:hypothetical protein
MFWLETQVVRLLVADEPPERQRAVAAYVDESLRDMPEVLRLGVGGESVVLGLLTRVDALRSSRVAAVERRLERCRTSRINVIRQYERLLNSLVVFASLELQITPADAREPLPAIA